MGPAVTRGTTLAVGADLEELRIPVQTATIPEQRTASAVEHALATNERHAAALRALSPPSVRPIADEALQALEKEKQALESVTST
jgi:hypothetical protein